MRLERFSLVVLSVVLLIVLAVPFWRRLALSQLRQTVPGARYSIWDNSTFPYVPNPRPKTDAPTAVSPCPRGRVSRSISAERS